MEISNKFSASILQTFAKKLFVKPFPETFHLSESKTTIICYGRSCVQLGKENRERRVELDFRRKVEFVPFGEEQKD